MTSVDLFALAEGPALTPKQRRALQDRTKLGGYAARPGSGPEGETCKSCQHRVRHESGGGKVFQKCGLIKWTFGAATDIRAGAAACSRWEKLA